ncbi:MAG: polymer-forming cytoskeletal protein, partial [Planctomycetota bacterium]|nr:polymer-forming cytoskeletal protein [Planctomycetota bacterium]
MSPIRPALGAVHPRPPDPPGARPVRCPACAHLFPTSRKAMSIRCPRCTTHLRLEDFTFRRNASADINTHGHVRVTSASSVSGEVVCGQLTNSGRFNGSAVVHGPVELSEASFTTGDIAAQSLRVSHGAVLRGKIHIAPSLQVPPKGVTRRPATPPMAVLPATLQ